MKMEVAVGMEFGSIKCQVMLCVLLSFKTLLASMTLIYLQVAFGRILILFCTCYETWPSKSWPSENEVHELKMGMQRKDKDQKEYILSTDVFYGDPLHMEKNTKASFLAVHFSCTLYMQLKKGWHQKYNKSSLNQRLHFCLSFTSLSFVVNLHAKTETYHSYCCLFSGSTRQDRFA